MQALQLTGSPIVQGSTPIVSQITYQSQWSSCIAVEFTLRSGRGRIQGTCCSLPESLTPCTHLQFPVPLNHSQLHKITAHQTCCSFSSKLSSSNSSSSRKKGMQATSFAGASVSGKRVAFGSARRCSHVVQAAVAVPTQVRDSIFSRAAAAALAAVWQHCCINVYADVCVMLM